MRVRGHCWQWGLEERDGLLLSGPSGTWKSLTMFWNRSRCGLVHVTQADCSEVVMKGEGHVYAVACLLSEWQLSKMNRALLLQSNGISE